MGENPRARAEREMLRRSIDEVLSGVEDRTTRARLIGLRDGTVSLREYAAGLTEGSTQFAAMTSVAHQVAAMPADQRGALVRAVDEQIDAVAREQQVPPDRARPDTHDEDEDDRFLRDSW